MQYEKDKENHKGRARDFYGFDEITEFSETQFRYVTTWNRSTKRGQRCRIICTCNPPTSTEGEWIVKFWAPWLDKHHQNPAKPGELRWFTTINEKDIEVPDNRPFVVIDDKPCYDFNPADYKPTEIIMPRSRTFVPAKLIDNPYLADTGYAATLQALPEPLRSQMLNGDFEAGQQDDAYQVIPSEWVRLAQERWRKRQKPQTPLSALGVDVARGGTDFTQLAPRYDNYFDKLLSHPGESTPNGQHVAGLAVQARDRLGGNTETRINIDVIGVGSSPYDWTLAVHKNTYGMNASCKSEARDKSKQLGFVNKRAEWHWKFREALDPLNGQDIALPADDRELAVDLCSPRWKLTPRGIQVESKDEIKERIGRSPDKGDAVIYANAIEDKATSGLSIF